MFLFKRKKITVAFSLLIFQSILQLFLTTQHVSVYVCCELFWGRFQSINVPEEKIINKTEEEEKEAGGGGEREDEAFF